MVKRCHCCGQVIPPKIGALDNARVKKRIYEFIARNPQGVSRAQILDSVYADDIDGGPDGVTVISVHIAGINNLLEPEGVKIHSTRGPYAVYRVVAL